jgi:predicted SprT family Zn-dependent metalloprotease
MCSSPQPKEIPMSEVSRKVTPYEYNYICDKCNGGMMRSTDTKDEAGLTIHKCMICSNKLSLSKSYPHVEYFGEGEEPKI